MNNNKNFSENFRLGDKVFDIHYGYGEIIKILSNKKYPINVKFYNIDTVKTYTILGCWMIGSPITLFKVEKD